MESLCKAALVTVDDSIAMLRGIKPLMRGMKSPDEKYEEKLREIENSIDEAWAKYDRVGTGDPVRKVSRDQALRLEAELEEFQQHYKASRSKEYQEHQLTSQRFYLGVLKNMAKNLEGPLLGELVDDLNVYQADTTKNHPTANAADDPEERDRDVIVVDPGESPQDYVQGIQSERHPSPGYYGENEQEDAGTGRKERGNPKQPAKSLGKLEFMKGVTVSKGTELRMHRGNVTASPERGQNSTQEAITRPSSRSRASESHKRKHTTSHEGSNPEKRQHIGLETIEFEEVYQDGNAERKYFIVQFPTKGDKKFYILRCRKHPNVFFYKKVLQGAAKHLDSAGHSQRQRTYEGAISKLGVEVLNCTEELCKLNNEALSEALMQGYTPPGIEDEHNALRNKVIQNRTSVHSAQESIRNSAKFRESRNAIRHPEVGRVYNGFWGNSKKPWPVIVLPVQGSCRDAGFSFAIEDLDLLSQLPECYEVDSNGEVRRWAQGFRDGEPRAVEREYPVLFFDNPYFPDGCRITWIPMRKLEEFDPLQVSERERLMVELWRRRSGLFGFADKSAVDGRANKNPLESHEENSVRRLSVEGSSAAASGTKHEEARSGPRTRQEQEQGDNNRDGESAGHHELLDGPGDGYSQGHAFDAAPNTPLGSDNTPGPNLSDSNILQLASKAYGQIPFKHLPGQHEGSPLVNNPKPVTTGGQSVARPIEEDKPETSVSSDGCPILQTEQPVGRAISREEGPRSLARPAAQTILSGVQARRTPGLTEHVASVPVTDSTEGQRSISNDRPNGARKGSRFSVPLSGALTSAKNQSGPGMCNTTGLHDTPRASQGLCGWKEVNWRG